MEDMINFMSRFMTKITPNESLTSFLKTKTQKENGFIFEPREYFFLTSLCSPMDTYMKSKFPDIKPSLETLKQYSIGNKFHSLAINWFQKMDGFESSESVLDGVYFGLPVRGKIDAKIGNCIVELKTKEIIPNNEKELVEKYPQDIEQVGFYACIDPLKPETNYLIFLSHENPSKLKTFKIIIKDFNKIKLVLKERIDELKDALEKNDPSRLGKCRYDGKYNLEEIFPELELFERGCEIFDFIEISEDEEFNEKFKEVMSSWDGYQDTITPYNIIAPRKYLNKQITGVAEEFFEDSNKVRDKNYVREMAFELKNSFSPKENTIPEKFFKEIPFSTHSWINLISSIDREGKTLPFLAHSSSDTRPEALNQPPQYKIAELGIIVANFNLSKGILIIYYPKLGENQYKVFEINYSFPDSCKIKIKEIIEILKLEDINKLKELPPCPSWMHKLGEPNLCCS